MWAGCSSADHAVRASLHLGAGAGQRFVRPPKGNGPHVDHETRLLATATVGLSAAVLGVAATRDAGCSAMTDRTIPVIFWTVMGALLVSLLVLVLAA
jgi:hypothetical protein